MVDTFANCIKGLIKKYLIGQTDFSHSYQTNFIIQTLAKASQEKSQEPSVSFFTHRTSQDADWSKPLWFVRRLNRGKMDFTYHATSQGNWGVWISVPHFMHISINIHRMVFLFFGINIKKRICCHRDVHRHPAPAQIGDEPAERSEVVDWESCQLHWRTTDSPLKHSSSECRVNRACLDTGREINQTLKVLQEKLTGSDLSWFGRENWIKLCFLTKQ